MKANRAWQTFIFSGATADEASKAFNEWFGYDGLSLTRQPISRTADGQLLMTITHCPWPDRHQMYVTALMPAVSDE